MPHQRNKSFRIFVFVSKIFTLLCILFFHTRGLTRNIVLHDVQRHISTRLTYKSNQTKTLCMHTIHKHAETTRSTCVIRDNKQVSDTSNRSGICNNNTGILSSNKATHPFLTCLHQKTR